ncbi:MAG: hypothetical protein R6X20_14780 [Phycisphaerae bacterium]
MRLHTCVLLLAVALWPGRAGVAAEKAETALDAYLDRSYYTTEASARVLVTAPAGVPVSVQVAGKAGRPLATAEATAGEGETAVAIPLADVPLGEWPVVVELRDGGRTARRARPLTLRKLPPVPDGASEVKVDHQNRALLLDGEPFFPHGIWSGHLEQEWLRLYRDAGFNTVLLWQGPGRDLPAARGLADFDRLRTHGLRAVPRPLTYLKPYGGLRRNDGLVACTEELGREVRALRRHPAVLAWYGVDEPPTTGWEAGLRAFRQAVRQADPYHPVYVSGSTPSKRSAYDLADIHGRHAYWGPMGSAAHRTPNRVARVAAWTYGNVTEPARRPLFFIVQGEFTSHSRRGLTPAERRVTVYLALVHGAKSLLYFRGPIYHRATAESMKDLAAEIRTLAPALLRRRPPQEILVTPAPPDGLTSPSTHQYDLPIVQAALLDRPGGGRLLVAANSSRKPVEATWNLKALGEGLRVSHLFSGECCRVEAGVLRDRFDAYGTRVYRLEGGSRGAGEKAVIRLDLAGPAVADARQVAKPDPKTAPAPRGKNLIINSSFEAAALPGWPDSWWFGYPTPDRMCGDPDGPGQDDAEPWHGRVSLRLVNPGGPGSGNTAAVYRHRFKGTGRRGGVPVAKGRPYTLSASMRAEADGTPVEMVLCNYNFNSRRMDEGSRRTVRLTTGWKRYEVTTTFPETGWREGHRPELAVLLRHGRAEGRSVWIDAVQLEQAPRATPYEP